MTLTPDDLTVSTCTEQFYFAPQFPKVNYSDGIKHIRDNGLSWLIDVISSYECVNVPFQNAKKAAPALDEFRLWTLKVDTKTQTAVVTCREDTGKPAVVTQKVPFTDCPLAEVKVYAFTEGDIIRLIMPSEY